MNFPAIRIEGAILSPELLERLEDAAGQRPVDFGLEAGARVKDEIARAWADAQDYWRIFGRKLQALKPDSPATSETRQQWVVPLLSLLGYGLDYQPRPVEGEGKSYPISHRLANRGGAPVHITGWAEPAGLDRKPERGSLRMSAHAMLQEYLNLADELYGIVTNGRILRLLRDSSRLVKLTYLEFDLERIFGEGLFADFAVLYRLLHVSRLPASREDAADSLIERYHQESLEAGARIRSGLSRAVESAIRDFGNGFLSHPANDELRAAAAAGELTPRAYYGSLLRLIYRILFLLVIEERGLVFPPEVEEGKRAIYTQYYSLGRLRRLAEGRRLLGERAHDLWLGLLATFRLFEADGPGAALGVPPLAGELFDSQAIGLLGRALLANDVLLGCLHSLGLYRRPDNGQIVRVNYAALNVEEFGSVYEGLLEYAPALLPDGGPAQWRFVLAPGDERAATGSHYTDDDLVQPLLKHSLDHLIAAALRQPDAQARAAALLDLRVADIACGSGHILLAAARRIAAALAGVRTGEDQPAPPAYRAALRQVIGTCIYGVDLNPLAVELCKVALWLEAHAPGQPLDFLDHHIKCGNSIVGFVGREELEAGVPDEAFATQPGDEKETAAALRKRNKAEAKARAQASLELDDSTHRHYRALLAGTQGLAALPAATPTERAAKKARYEALAGSADAWALRQVAAIPIAQFYAPKTKADARRVITDGEHREYLGGRQPQGEATGWAWAKAEEKRFFHWFLEFPDIVARGGFDCILGNPPYLGGQELSGTYGYPFCHYVKWQYAPAGLSDLVVYFVRRMFALLKPGGFASFITTNSIKDGDVRKDGLEQVLAAGGSIHFAVRGIKWPGRANLVVSLVGLYKGLWKEKRLLDGQEVTAISAYFDDNIDSGEPITLANQGDWMFSGSYFLGDGFLVDNATAQEMVTEDPHLSEVLIPAINGEELNSHPEQVASRCAIFFADWPLARAEAYGAAFDRVVNLVKPERERSDEKPVREKWWLWKRPALEIYRRIQGKPQCFVAARTTKHLNFSAMPTDIIYTNALYVFTTDRWDLYAVVQSTLHEVWARKYSGALETRLRYSPSDCFETFAFPAGLWQAADPALAAAGETYHEHRRGLMRRLWLGLTDLYNLFHHPDLSPDLVGRVAKQPPEAAAAGYTGILDLRRLHAALDRAVLAAYGWGDLDLQHGFHAVETLPENDRVRYTISPPARKEVLRRLLALNLARGEEEKEAEAGKAAAKPKSRGKAQADKEKTIKEQQQDYLFREL